MQNRKGYDNPYGIVHATDDFTPMGRVMFDSASAVDETSTWQFLGSTGKLDDETDEFMFKVGSRGPIPTLPEAVFTDIEESVTIDADPYEEGPRKVHFIRYNGDAAGLNFFVNVLTESLDHGAEGDVDLVGEWIERNPGGVAAALLSR